jgi:3-dehydroquinate dehydratase/shikimate dehydrogenase
VAKICLCLTARTLAGDLELLEKNRAYIDMAELRVDCLDPDERFHIRRFPEQAGIPVILTIRRDLDGGNFSEGEGGRIRLLSQGLAFAEADHRKNFAYIDLEEDLDVPSLEEAARTFGTRIIRSSHSFSGMEADVPGKIRKLRRVGDEIVKIALMARGSADALAMVRSAKALRDADKIFLCMGPYGTFTRILAEKLGSRISYTSAGEEGVPAQGQLQPRDLVELYRFRSIGPGTKVFGMTGHPQVAGAPKFFNTLFSLEDTDAVYVPFPADSVEDFMSLAEELELSGASVTGPYKEAVIGCLDSLSEDVERTGACNTIIREPQGWRGANTDSRSFSDSLLNFMEGLRGGEGRGNSYPGARGLFRAGLRGRRITLIGAGGAARTAAAELYRLGARVLILNRSPAKARSLAAPYRFRWGGLDEPGVRQAEKFSDLIIQASSAGTEGNPGQDPLELYSFSGREIVMDLIYEPEQTPFLRRAAEAGCAVLNGYDMLVRQARYQYSHFFGRDFPPALLPRAVI